MLVLAPLWLTLLTCCSTSRSVRVALFLLNADCLHGAHNSLADTQGFHAGMYSSIISNGLGFTSYEIGVQKYRDWNYGRSPSSAERGFIAGAAAALHGCCLLGSCEQQPLIKHAAAASLWAAKAERQCQYEWSTERLHVGHIAGVQLMVNST